MLARRRRENFDVFNLFNGFPFNFLQILKRKIFHLNSKFSPNGKNLKIFPFETEKKHCLQLISVRLDPNQVADSCFRDQTLKSHINPYL